MAYQPRYAASGYDDDRRRRPGLGGTGSEYDDGLGTHRRGGHGSEVGYDDQQFRGGVRNMPGAYGEADRYDDDLGRHRRTGVGYDDGLRGHRDYDYEEGYEGGYSRGRSEGGLESDIRHRRHEDAAYREGYLEGELDEHRHDHRYEGEGYYGDEYDEYGHGYDDPRAGGGLVGYEEDEFLRRDRDLLYKDELLAEESLYRERHLGSEAVALEEELANRRAELYRERELGRLEEQDFLAREAELDLDRQPHRHGYGGFVDGGELLYGDDYPHMYEDELGLDRGLSSLTLQERSNALADERERDILLERQNFQDAAAIRRESELLDRERSALEHERRMHEFRDEQAVIDNERRDLVIHEEKLGLMELEKLEDERYLDERAFYEWEEGIERGYEDRLRRMEVAFERDNYLDRVLASEDWERGSTVTTITTERWGDPAWAETRIRQDPLSAMDGFDYIGLGWADDYVVPQGAHDQRGVLTESYDRGVYYHDPSWYVKGRTPYHKLNGGVQVGGRVINSGGTTTTTTTTQVFSGLNGYGSLGNFSLPRLGLSDRFTDEMLALRDLRMFEDALRFDEAIDDIEKRRRWRDRLRWEELELEERKLRWARMREEERWRLGLGPTGFWGTRFSGRRPGVAIKGRGVGYGAGVAPGYGLGGYGGYRSVVRGRPYYGPNKQQVATLYSNGRYRAKHYPLSTLLSRRYVPLLTSMIQRRTPPRLRTDLASMDKARRRGIREIEAVNRLHNSTKMLELKTRLELAELRASLSGATIEMRKQAEEDIRSIRSEMETELELTSQENRLGLERDLIEDARDAEAARLEYERAMINRQAVDNEAESEDKLGRLKLEELRLQRQLAELDDRRAMRQATSLADRALGGRTPPLAIEGVKTTIVETSGVSAVGPVRTTTTTTTRDVIPSGGIRVPIPSGRPTDRRAIGPPLRAPIRRPTDGRGMPVISTTRSVVTTEREIDESRRGGDRLPIVRPNPASSRELLDPRGSGQRYPVGRSPVGGRYGARDADTLLARTPSPGASNSYARTHTTTTTTTSLMETGNRPPIL